MEPVALNGDGVEVVQLIALPSTTANQIVGQITVVQEHPQQQLRQPQQQRRLQLLQQLLRQPQQLQQQPREQRQLLQQRPAVHQLVYQLLQLVEASSW